MGFITNQWLKGIVERNRSRDPISVTLEAKVAEGYWNEGRKVSRELITIRENEDYQVISFTKGELNTVVPLLATAASMAVRKRVAMDAITDLEDDEFVDFINRALSRRIAAKRRANSKTG